jgi:hypothetical protein
VCETMIFNRCDTSGQEAFSNLSPQRRSSHPRFQRGRTAIIHQHRQMILTPGSSRVRRRFHSRGQQYGSRPLCCQQHRSGEGRGDQSNRVWRIQISSKRGWGQVSIEERQRESMVELGSPNGPNAGGGGMAVLRNHDSGEII